MTSREYAELRRLIEERSAVDDRRFAVSEARFQRIDQRFQKIDRRFEAVDRRFEAVDRRFDQISAEIRAAAVETRVHLDAVAEKFSEDVKKIANGYLHHEKVLDDHEARVKRLEQARLRFDG